MQKTSKGHPRLRWKVMSLLLVTAALMALVIGWSWSPMRGWLDIDLIVPFLQGAGHTFGPVVSAFGFALAVSLAVPLTLLTLVTLVAFGPWAGFACSMAGALVGAALSYWVGRSLGREVMESFAGPKMNLLSQQLARRGVLAVVVVRMVPVAPFAFVNMVAGISHIRLVDLLLGTGIGMLPSTLVMMIFTDQIISAMKRPNLTSMLMLGLTVILVVIGVAGIRHWIARLIVSE
jgi:uncharacterized membrane protein YdjX (TVP38/TMEM64 family)